MLKVSNGGLNFFRIFLVLKVKRLRNTTGREVPGFALDDDHHKSVNTPANPLQSMFSNVEDIRSNTNNPPLQSTDA